MIKRANSINLVKKGYDWDFQQEKDKQHEDACTYILLLLHSYQIRNYQYLTQ